MNCPYHIICPDVIIIICFRFANNNYTMEMVRHHHEFIDLNVGISLRNLAPTFSHNLSKSIHLHARIDNLAAQTLSFLHANGYEIPPFTRIIIILQSNGTAMMYVWIVFQKGSGKLFAFNAPLCSALLLALLIWTVLSGSDYERLSNCSRWCSKWCI